MEKVMITEQWLAENKACPEGVEWLKSRKADFAGDLLVEILMKEKKFDWANWLIVRIMPYADYVAYAVYAAEQVVGVYQKQYPNDNRPREAIDAAKKCITNPTAENKSAASAAASTASAAYAASAASAAYDVASAASAAAYAAMKIKILKYGLKLLKEENHGKQTT